MSRGSHAVRIPAEYRFSGKEVGIRRDAQSGDVILWELPGDGEASFAAFDAAGVPDDFLVNRGQELAPERR